MSLQRHDGRRLASWRQEGPEALRKTVIDGEFVLVDDRSVPNFYKLHRAMARLRHEPFVIFAFDIMHKNGVDLVGLPLLERKKRLASVISEAVPAVQVVEAFDDGVALLAACTKMGLEGIVSKRRDAAYRSGPSRDWVKVKTEGWRAANRERWRLFER